MAENEKKNDEQVQEDQKASEYDDRREPVKPGSEAPTLSGFDGVPLRRDDPSGNGFATESGVGADLRVDSPVNPKGKDDPRPTSA